MEVSHQDMNRPGSFASPAPRLTSPLWPRSRWNRTSPLNLMLTGLCVSLGFVIYAKGYTYEGAMLAYMISTIVFAWPYFRAKYTRWMAPLIMVTILPQLLWAQNKGVESGNWSYVPEAKHLLGKVTEQGQGPFGWTRIFYFGNVMPTVEYIFFPAMGVFQMTAFTLFVSVLPERFLVRRRRNGIAFYVFYGAFTLLFAVLFYIFNHKEMDFTWCMMCVGISTTWIGLAISRSYRALVETPAMWLWLLFMGFIFMTLFDLFHSCLNHDWLFASRPTMPAMYTINGAPITLVEPFGYIALATAFPAHISMYADHLKRIVVRSEEAVPRPDLRDGAPSP
jgi:hypothetical protein